MIKENQTNVASAWSNYQSNQSLLNSVRSQVNAAEIANEGILQNIIVVLTKGPLLKLYNQIPFFLMHKFH